MEIEHDELGRTITYPGSFATTSEASPLVLRRAPLIGEHNREILHEELKYSENWLDSLRKAGVTS